MTAAAAEELKTSLLSWPGPRTHKVFLKRGRSMSLETAKKAVDFIFTVPGPALSIEIHGGAGAWPGLRFMAQYARRKSEWNGRPLRMAVVLSEPLVYDRSAFLENCGVEIAAAILLRGLPRPGKNPFFASRVLASVHPAAGDPAGWVALMEQAGVEWARLSPARDPLESRRRPGFLAFYAQALARMAQGTVREERAAAFLSARRWCLPGQDVLAELAYAPDGHVYTSEQGMALAERGRGLFWLGPLGELEYDSLGGREVVQAALAAACGDAQPRCFHCAYKPYCSIPPAVHFRDQGSVWGQTPSSAACALHMGMLDAIFRGLSPEIRASMMERWPIDLP